MKKMTFTDSLRKCSPLALPALGAAVCLSGGNASAVSGNITGSNAAQTFNAAVPAVRLFNSLVSFSFYNYAGKGAVQFKNGARPGAAGLYLDHLGAGVNVSGLSFANYRYVGHSTSNNYLGVRFNSGGTKYGWVHVISTSGNGLQLKMDTWSYNSSGGAIKTLGESITPKKIALSDGRVKLNWSNANEDGVARYEVQSKRADGTWTAVDSDVPGSASYAATVQAGDYRLLVENADGSSREISF